VGIAAADGEMVLPGCTPPFKTLESGDHFCHCALLAAAALALLLAFGGTRWDGVLLRLIRSAADVLRVIVRRG